LFLTRVVLFVAGHEAVASIAMKYLNPTASSALQTILANDGGGDLVQICNWADQVRSNPDYKWSATLHYIDTPDWSCNFDHQRDCANEQCVAGAIANYSSRVTIPAAADEAAKFITHFSGDIHQPLHVAFTSDRGGNLLKGSFLGQSVNLHACWDTSIIDARMQQDFSGSQSAYFNFLLGGVTQANITAWTSCLSPGSPVSSCVDSWAEETAALACTYAYSNTDGSHIQDGFDLGQDYYLRAAPIVDEQLQKGGVRLATLFNSLFQ
jgi:hypothetical protein